MSPNEPSLYERLLAAGVPIDHHESDLYVMATPEAREILRTHGAGRTIGFFVSQVDGRVWADIAFAYQPFWDKKQKAAETRVVDRLLRDIRDPSP